MTVTNRMAFYETVLRSDKEVTKVIPCYLLTTDLGQMWEPVDCLFGTPNLAIPQKDINEQVKGIRLGFCVVSGTRLHNFSTNDAGA
jgi:hypothetical protein